MKQSKRPHFFKEGDGVFVLGGRKRVLAMLVAGLITETEARSLFSKATEFVKLIRRSLADKKSGYAIRDGRAREREIAVRELKARIGNP